MENHELLYNGWIWLLVTALTLYLCIAIPIKIENDFWRKMAYWFILIPTSLIIILYVYPVGIELFRRWSVHL